MVGAYVPGLVAGAELMWPYWLMFLLPAILAINQGPVRLPLPKKWPIVWWVAFFFIVLMVGFRNEVGGDWIAYRNMLERVFYEPWHEQVLSSEPSYLTLNWIAAHFSGGIYIVNFISAIIFSWGLVVFCRSQPRPWLALSIAIPYLVVVVAMGYTRQAISIGLVMMAFIALFEKRMLHYFIFMAFAVTFHKSAIIMLPLVALTSAKNRWFKVFLVLLLGILLYWVLIRGATDRYMEHYIGSGYSSAGAAIRIAMNAIPAGLFLLFRKRFRLPKDQNSFWTMMSLLAFGFVVFLMMSPSSTVVDRLALYWIPIQLFVFSRLPDVFGRQGGANTTWVFLILLYYLAVLAIWLIFAAHANLWLPYKFFPWDWLWDAPPTRF